MHTRFRTVASLSLLSFFSSGPLLADEPGPVQRLPLSAEDIASVTGLNIYKYRIAMEPGTKFEVAVSVQNDADSKPRFLHRHSFVSDTGMDGVDLLLSFLPRDDKLRGVLLSQDEEVEYRVDCSGCSPSGISTILSLPLKEIHGTHKTLTPMAAERLRDSSDDNEVPLIAIFESKPGKPVPTKEAFPRAKVSVRFEN